MNPYIDSNGNKRWYNSLEQLDRLDGPAVEWVDGTKSWYKDGKRHHLDGPASEWTNGIKEWWVNGKQTTEDKLESAVNE